MGRVMGYNLERDVREISKLVEKLASVCNVPVLCGRYRWSWQTISGRL